MENKTKNCGCNNSINEFQRDRQLRNPDTEMLVVKNGKVQVIDKKDWKKYKSKGYIVAENGRKIVEASLSVIHKAAKKGSYPVTVMAIDKKKRKVVKQELVKTPMAVPAAFMMMQGAYPEASISVEDATGQVLFSESVNEAVKRGKKYGDWTVIQYEPVEYDDYGAPNGGRIKIVNQKTGNDLLIQNDLALRGSKWYISINRRTIKDTNPETVIQKAIKNSVNEGKDFKKVKKDKYGNHLEPQFKKGDKVTYLGNKGVITNVNKEMSGAYSYNVSYDKGSGKTKASNIFNKDGKTIQLESVNESVNESIIATLAVLGTGVISVFTLLQLLAALKFNAHRNDFKDAHLRYNDLLAWWSPKDFIKAWKLVKKDKKVLKIVNRLKDDDEVKEFLKNPKQAGWQKMLAKKLDASEMGVIKSIYKRHFHDDVPKMNSWDSRNESVNEANSEFVTFIEKDNGRKKLLRTSKSQRAANMFMRKHMDSILNKSGIRSIGTMSKDQWEKKEAMYAENIKKSDMKTVTKKEWDRTHKDYKGMIKGQPYMMWFDKKTQSTVYGPVHIKESVNEGISVFDERHFGKKGIIIMIDDNGKKVSAIFKDKKNADKYNRNKPSDIKKLLQLAKKTPYPKAIDEGKGDFGGWVAIYKGKRLEIDKSEANGIYGAKQIAIKKLKVPKSKQSLLAIAPAVEESVNESSLPIVDKKYGIAKVDDGKGNTWYVKKIDSTHMFMANDPKYLKKDRPTGVMAHHIGQHRDEPYYSELRSWLKESVNEAATRRSEDFFDEYKHGKEIRKMLKGTWNTSKVKKYLDTVGGSDIKWARIMDDMANRLGLDHRRYNNRPMNDMVNDILDKMEKLYSIHMSESVNESDVNEMKYSNQTGIKSSLLKNNEFNSLLNSKEMRWIKGNDVKIYKDRFGFTFTDGKREMVFNLKKPYSVVKPMGNTRSEIKKVYQQNESVNEATEPQIITQLRDVMENGYQKLKDPKTGKKVMVDSFSASAMVKVYDGLKNPSVREKYVNSGLFGMQKLAFKFVK